MDLSEFDFDLPEERIALRPARPRDAARLLHVRGDALGEHLVRDLPSLLRPGDVLVVNTTRVTPAALKGRRPPRPSADGAPEATTGEGAAIDVNLIRREGDAVWTALARPGKRLRVGDVVVFPDGLEARVEAKLDAGAVRLAFNREGARLDAAIAAVGAAPLPPYIARRRPADARDREDYQTVFARDDGAVAAPTAGLHFTPELLARLGEAGIARAEVTLHVGAGTFAPLDEAALASGALHAERCVLDPAAADALNAARAAGGRIVAVGTTSLRTLETAVDAEGRFHAFDGETDIFIRPGHAFAGVDVLMTNFHLPRSSLFMLVCAFAGVDAMRAAYSFAVSHKFRFYSYGDASLLELLK